MAFTALPGVKMHLLFWTISPPTYNYLTTTGIWMHGCMRERMIEAWRQVLDLAYRGQDTIGWEEAEAIESNMVFGV